MSFTAGAPFAAIKRIQTGQTFGAGTNQPVTLPFAVDWGKTYILCTENVGPIDSTHFMAFNVAGVTFNWQVIESY